MEQLNAPPENDVPLDFTEFTGSLGDAAKDYMHKERRYLELLVSDRIARVSSTVVIALLTLMLLNWGILLLLIAGAKALGDALHNAVQGYLAMTGGVVLLMGVIALAAPALRRMIRTHVVNTLHGHD